MQESSLEMTSAWCMHDGRLVIVLNDGSRCILTLRDALEVGVFEVDPDPPAPRTVVRFSHGRPGGPVSRT